MHFLMIWEPIWTVKWEPASSVAEMAAYHITIRKEPSPLHFAKALFNEHCIVEGVRILEAKLSFAETNQSRIRMESKNKMREALHDMASKNREYRIGRSLICLTAGGK